MMTLQSQIRHLHTLLNVQKHFSMGTGLAPSFIMKILLSKLTQWHQLNSSMQLTSAKAG